MEIVALLLPLPRNYNECISMRTSNYDKHPATVVQGTLWQGWDAVREELSAACQAVGAQREVRGGAGVRGVHLGAQ